MDLDIAALGGYGAAALLLGLGLVQLAGHFPASGRPPERRTPAFRALVWLNLALLTGLLLAAAALVIGRLAWPAAVIAGGLALLAAPLLFQALPPRWRDGRRGLAGQAALSGLLLLLLAPLLQA